MGRAAARAERREADGIGSDHARLQGVAHLVERVALLPLRLGRDAVARDDDLEPAHVGVHRGEEDADVRREPGDGHRVHVQLREQDVAVPNIAEQARVIPSFRSTGW